MNTAKKFITPPPAAVDDPFRRLAVTRVNVALEALRHVRALANAANYTYTDAQAEAVLAALGTEVESLFRAFRSKGKEGPFTL